MFTFLTALIALTSPVTYPPEVFWENDLYALTPQPLILKKEGEIAPLLDHHERLSYLSIDLETGQPLLSFRSHRPQYIASISKLMTALIILENHSLEEKVIVPPEAHQTEGSKIELYAQEVLTVKTLLEALLISSANDAAIALAHHHSGSEEKFAEKMNQKAQEMGFTSSYFYNSSGLDEIQEFPDNRPFEIYGNQMSAQEIAQLSQKIWNYDFVRETVSKPIFQGTSVDGKFFHEKKTTNQLLGNFLDIKGLKTGFTYLAGECLVTIGETPQGREILTIILGSNDRFDESKKVTAWVYDAYHWEE